MGLKACSVFQVPIMFPVTDCLSLGLVLSRVLWRLIQADAILHGLHQEFIVWWSEAEGSFTNLLFDLHAHDRVWRGLIAPLLEVIAAHLLFPWVFAHTILACFFDEDQEFI